MSNDDQPSNEPVYKVGYRRPPRDHQFKPGHKLSKGRPKGSKNTRDLMLAAWHTLRRRTIDGEIRRVSASEVGCHNIAVKAAKGDLKAFQLMMENEAAIAHKAEAKIRDSSLQERVDRLTIASIVERIRLSAAEIDRDRIDAEAVDVIDQKDAPEPIPR